MTASGLTESQLTTLKQLIHEHLRHSGVYESLRAIVAQVVSGGAAADGGGEAYDDEASTEAVILALQQKGIISDLLGTMAPQLAHAARELPPDATGRAPPSLPALLTGERYLYISLLGGKAFVEHIAPRGADGRAGGAQLSLCVQFGSQRARSKPVPASVEPPFDDSFLLKLPQPAGPRDDGAGGGARALLGRKQLLHLVVVRSSADGTSSEVVGTHLLEWRKALTAPAAAGLTVSVELSGVREEAKLPVGLLTMRLELLPPAAARGAEAEEGLPGERELAAQLRAERAAETDAERAFFSHARAWWHEYLQLRPSHASRLVKIFAQTEFGVQRPVTTFVRPLFAERLLESAAHAARFVALLPFERHQAVGDGASEAWSTSHSFLCRRRGDADEHALLLCSLLLGYGLDAYVVIGTDTQGGHLWVITRQSATRTIFWESLSGQRTAHELHGVDDPARTAHFRSVGCVFNHESFYANVQPDDSVAACSFELESRQHWRPMDPDLIRPLTPMPTPSLVASSQPPAAAAAEALEGALRALIAEHREPLGLATFWDDRLSALLTPALAAYESERVHGAAYGNEEFQQAIKRHVPEGHTFKGFPQQFTHTLPSLVLFGLLKSQVALDVLQARGELVRHAVRVKVVNYPDDVRAVWVMVAVKYKKLAAAHHR